MAWCLTALCAAALSLITVVALTPLFRDLLQMATATGLLQRLRPQHVFANIDAAVLWARSHRE
jgi:hypothetical protein